MEFPGYTFPLQFDFEHHQTQNTDPKTELVPISLVKPFFFLKIYCLQFFLWQLSACH